MFSTPSAARTLLGQWTREILDEITFDSPDRTYLDEITTCEVLDMTYNEGGLLSEATAAHTLFPVGVELQEAARGIGAHSTMEAIFPVDIEEDGWGLTVHLRAGQPSRLAIGQGGVFPRVNPDGAPPATMLTPRIGGTRYDGLREQGGTRLKVLAGPLTVVDETVDVLVSAATGSRREQFALPATRHTYAYIDGGGALQMREGADGLLPLETLGRVPEHPRSFYLREERSALALHLEVSWKETQPGQALLRVTLRLEAGSAPAERVKASEGYIRALVLPHVFIALRRARAVFPAQQYAEAKNEFLHVTEDERHDVARARLYQVRQSGCIATRHPRDEARVTLTTFGVFDTPREIPVTGPPVDLVARYPEDLFAHYPGHDAATATFVRENWEVISAIFLAARDAFGLEHFHLFQWDAITTGLGLEANGCANVTTIVRAPTSAGKTIVFMINAAVSALCGERRSTSLLLFPTRLLNEDMHRKLTAFVYHLRCRLPQRDVSGGLFLGTSDPLFRLALKPKDGESMHHYGVCPACRTGYLVARMHGPTAKLTPTCSECGHHVTYMHDPYDVPTYLPDIIIATPDKIFYAATASGYEQFGYGLFGAPVRQCTGCGRTRPEAFFALKQLPATAPCATVYSKDQHRCAGVFSTPATAKPIRYIGFDEVHNLYGQTVTYLSAFLTTLQVMQRTLSRQRDLVIRYETATATIANERELLQAITRRGTQAGEIIAIPAGNALMGRFVISDDRIRHRVLLTMPARVNSRQAFLRAALNAYQHLRGPDPDLKRSLEAVTATPNAWDFLLGYVLKLQDGLDFRRSLVDYYRNRFNRTLNVEFLSGRSPKNRITSYVDQARAGVVDVLLGNLVVSLGIDINALNHMIMFGVPSGFTEYQQTVGRTGRGAAAGHVQVILLPHLPRDTYLYRHFHAVLSDVAGYYDVLPVRSTNLHCSDEIFGNVAKGILAALCLSKPLWPHRQGVQTAVAGQESALRGGISGLLCDDAGLKAETDEIVRRRFRLLMGAVVERQGFLVQVLKDKGWLLYSLRPRTMNMVRVACLDQELLAQMQQAVPEAVAGDDEPEDAEE
jgi:hypothetical protein